MSKEYDEYLKNHKEKVEKAFYIFSNYLEDVYVKLLFLQYGKTEADYEYKFDRNALDYQLKIRDFRNELEKEIRNNIMNHDNSKYSKEEYAAYDEYFYGSIKTSKVIEDFNKAWLHHIHNNPHHWQYWVLVNDDGTAHALDMEPIYIIEMVMDWFSFSLNKGSLDEIFEFYESNKSNMILSDNTRLLVEEILAKLNKRLKERKDFIEELKEINKNFLEKTFLIK